MLERPENGWERLVGQVLDGMRRQLSVDCVADIESLCTYLDLVVKWNRTHDLTAARSVEELVDLYLADAFVLRAFTEAGTWALCRKASLIATGSHYDS